jgi:hypothetical protein
MFFNIAGNPINVTRVNFADIQQGDTILHFVEDHNGNDFIWVGIAETKGNFSEEWYGNGRRSTKRNAERYDEITTTMFDAPFEAFTADTRPDVLIAAQWHETEAGHALYRVQ